MSKLEKMVALAEQLKIGEPIDYKGVEARIMAFSDEHVFVEVEVTPEELESGIAEKRVRDLRGEELERRVYQLEQEIDRILHDPSYRERRLDQAFRERRYRERRYDDMRVALDYGAVSIKNIGMVDFSPFIEAPPPPPKPVWIDPLWSKAPGAGQKKK